MDIAQIVQGFSAWASSAAADWGYLGLFFVNFIGSASIIFPLPAFAAVFLAGSILNPVLVGIIAAAGCALGELTGYGVGRGSKEVLKENKWIKRAEKWKEKTGIFPIIIISIIFAGLRINRSFDFIKKMI